MSDASLQPEDNGAEPLSGKRRPVASDVAAIMEIIAEGKSLRAACRELGLHNPSTNDFIHGNLDYREQYARAKEQRAEVMQEEGLTVTKAAALGQLVNGKKVDPAGARVYLDALKWASARMAPKTAPVQRVRVSYEDLSDEELDARIAESINGDDETTDEP